MQAHTHTQPHTHTHAGTHTGTLTTHESTQTTDTEKGCFQPEVKAQRCSHCRRDEDEQRVEVMGEVRHLPSNRGHHYCHGNSHSQQHNPGGSHGAHCGQLVNQPCLGVCREQTQRNAQCQSISQHSIKGASLLAK